MNPPVTNSAVPTHQGPAATASEIGANGPGADPCEQQGDDEEFNYEPIPSRNAVKLTVRYRVRGRGRPLPYPLDEESSE